MYPNFSLLAPSSKKIWALEAGRVVLDYRQGTTTHRFAVLQLSARFPITLSTQKITGIQQEYWCNYLYLRNSQPKFHAILMLKIFTLNFNI